ncbi:MAG TPA: NADH-quinone oxidoreductase subunit I [Symbiobacteriaceae bacterium]|nr:NADH-quinone oxidoreductase subunit I [Symbiobacteriaceae bacterium]
MGLTNFLGEAIRAGKSFATGLSITFKEMTMRPAITVFYPDEKDNVPAWFRGIPLQKTDLKTGEYKCTSCAMCVEACPVNVITLEWHQDPVTKKKVADRYAIDMSRCMLCNYCIEACPFDSLVMGYDYELSKVDPENLVYEFEDLLRLGLKYSSAEQPGPKAKKNATPPWVFHELTGATEADIQDTKGFLGRAPLAKGYEPELKPQFQTKTEETAPAQAEAGTPSGEEAN